MTIRVLYHREPEGWWAESPEIEGWTVAGDSCDEVRRPVADGSRSHLPVDRGEDFDEQRFAEVTVEHYVHAPA